MFVSACIHLLKLIVYICFQVPIAKTGMGRLCLLAEPWHLANVVESVKKLLKLQHVRLALARHGDLSKLISTESIQSCKLCQLYRETPKLFIRPVIFFKKLIIPSILWGGGN